MKAVETYSQIAFSISTGVKSPVREVISKSYRYLAYFRRFLLMRN